MFYIPILLFLSHIKAIEAKPVIPIWERRLGGGCKMAKWFLLVNLLTALSPFHRSCTSV